MAIALMVSLIGAVICASMASNKNLSVFPCALLGFFLPMIGVIIVACIKNAPTPLEAPPQQ